MNQSDSAVEITTVEDKPFALTQQEAAEIARVRLWTIQELCRRGEMPARKVGRHWRIPRSEFLAWLSGNQEVSDEESISVEMGSK